MRALKMRSVVTGHRKLTTTESIIKVDPLTTTWEVAEELNIDHSTVIWHLKQIGKMKKLNEWVPHEPTANQKIIVLKCPLLLFYATTMNHFSIGLWHVKQSGFYMTTGDDQLSGWTKKKLQTTSQSQTCTKKNGHGHCLVICYLSDPLQFPESWQNYYIWEVCSAKQWDTLKTAMLAASTGQQNGPNPPWNAQLHITQPTHQNLNELGYEVLLHPQYLPDLSPTDNHFKYLDNFLQEKHSHNQQEAECFARAHWLLKHRFLCYRNKQTYFSLAKNVLIVMVLILINKDMFEPSYNDNSWFKPQLFLYQPNNNISLGEDVE